ncbi:hypothetical protein MJD09_23555 [bacterium]|nr:hypothetical protein [bacterium]
MSTTRRTVLALLFAVGITHSGNAQITNVEDLIGANVADANVLIGQYLTPFGQGFGANLNNGWFNSAKPHKFLGFDITVTANVAIAPLADRTFDVSTLGLQNMRLANPNADPSAPTVVGEDIAGPEMEIFLNNPITRQDEIVGTFELPQGIGFRYVPSPMIQASVGLIADTEVMIRYLPEIEVDQEVGSLKLFGVGFKHSLNQWLAPGRLLPVDFSIMAGYTTFQAKSGEISVLPDPQAIPSGASYDNQEVEIEARSYTVNLLVSKKLAILTLFGGVGLESSNVDMKLKGNYPLTAFEDDIASPNFGQRVIEDVTDPVEISVDGANSGRAVAGFRLQLLVLAIHGSYTFSNYPVGTVGIGFSFR